MANSFIVTGGAGFIGSYICKSLINSDHHVLAVDNLTSGSLSNLDEIINHPNFEFHFADLKDENSLDEFISNYDAVIHLAAIVGVERVLSEPAFTMLNNIKCTETVLKSAYENRKRVFISSSSEVYGKQIKPLLSENNNIELYSPDIYRWAYACSKATDEFLAMSYAKMGLNVVTGRFFNVIGARQISCYGMVIPKFVKKALRNEPIPVFKKGRQTRCFCNVNDTVKAVIGLAQSDISAQVYNIGSNQEISVFELAMMIIEKCRSSSVINFIDDDGLPPGFDDVTKRVPDISKIRNDLGWTPEISLSQSIEEVIQYERERS